MTVLQDRPLQRSADRPRRKKLAFLNFTRREAALIGILTFPVMGTLFPLESYLYNDDGGGSGLPISTTLVMQMLLVYIVWLISRDIKTAVTMFRQNWIVFLYVAWTIASSFWSWSPGPAFNRAGRMLIFALYAVYIVQYLSNEKLTKIIVFSLVLSCAVSWLMIVAVPSLSYTTDMRGAWRGAMTHKNSLGVVAGFTVIMAYVAWKAQSLKTSSAAVILVMGGLLLVLANSATAFLSVVGIIAFLWLLRNVINRTSAPVPVLMVFGAVGGVLIWFLATSGLLLDLLNRDATLTGRSEIWEFVNSMIDQRPFWGYGLSVWTGDDFKITVLRNLGWQSPHAHNAWLDFRLQLGLPGFIIAVVMWAWAYVNVLRLIARRAALPVAFQIGLILFLLVRSYSETIMVDPSLGEIFWFALAFASFSKMLMETRRARLPQRPNLQVNYAR